MELFFLYFPVFELNTEIAFSPNARKYRPEKLQIQKIFTQCLYFISKCAFVSWSVITYVYTSSKPKLTLYKSPRNAKNSNTLIV